MTPLSKSGVRLPASAEIGNEWDTGWFRHAAVPPYFFLRCVEGPSGVEGITLGKFFLVILSTAGGAAPKKSLLLLLESAVAALAPPAHTLDERAHVTVILVAQHLRIHAEMPGNLIKSVVQR